MKSGSASVSGSTSAVVWRSSSRRFCRSCHSAGSAGGPRLRDLGNLGGRRLRRFDILLRHAFGKPLEIVAERRLGGWQTLGGTLGNQALRQPSDVFDIQPWTN